MSPHSVRIAILAIVWLAATATSADETRSLPPANGAFFAISVRNLDAAVAWYTAHLDFTVDSTADNEQRRGALLSRPGVLVELAEFRDAAQRHPRLESHELHGIFKLGFVTGELDATFAALQRSGIELFFPIVATGDGLRTFAIRDMDGNIIQFFGN